MEIQFSGTVVESNSGVNAHCQNFGLPAAVCFKRKVVPGFDDTVLITYFNNYVFN